MHYVQNCTKLNIGGYVSMNLISDSFTIFRTKKTRMPFLGEPKHGTPAWILDNNIMVEVIYSSKDNWPKGWVLASDFRDNIKKVKDLNRSFYQNHPNALSHKRQEKRRLASDTDSSPYSTMSRHMYNLI